MPATTLTGIAVECHFYLSNQYKMTSANPIPMVDLREQYLTLKSDIDGAVADVMSNTQFIMGPNVRTFEQEVADYLGVSDAIGCANGTDALHLALRGLGLGPGDEVITTPFTFIATAEAIAYVGATPVFVDIDPITYNLDIELVEAAVNANTRAIIPVHLFGLPCNMNALQTIANKHNLLVVEDCAQSFGAGVDGKKTGAIGDVGSHSFFPSKNLGCFGDGGMLTTNNAELAETLRVLRNHGSTKQYHHTVIGYNSRLDEMQAAILRQKLPHIDKFNKGRLRVATAYCEQLKDLDIQLPVLSAPASHGTAIPVFHQFTFLSDQRDAIKQALTEQRIASAVYYPIPLHQQKAIVEKMHTQASFPQAQSVAERCLSLPIYPEMSQESIDRVCATIKQVLQ